MQNETARSEFWAGQFVEHQTARLEKHFPGRKWRAPEWEVELLAMLVDLGEERMAAAITDVIRNGGMRDDGTRNTSFAPTVAELRNCAPRARFTRSFADKDCADCHGAGFVMVGEGKERRAKECACKRRPA